MGLLSTLLHEASARRPAEVVIETDRPVRMRLADGSSAELAAAIQGTAISDELSDLLSTEQQVDLALGEPVKFDLVVGLYTWHLVGETAQEVVSVRACPTGELLDASDSVQIPIEPDDIDMVDMSEPGARAEPQDIPRIRRAASSGPSEIDIDINFDDDAAAQTEERPPAGLRLAALKPVPADSKPQPMWPRQLGGPNWSREGRRGRAATQPAAAATSSTVGPASRTRQLPLRPSPRREDMAELLAAFEPGCLALLLRASGHADELVAALDLASLTLVDGDTPAQATTRLAQLGPGGALIVRAEDPSQWLAWLLRRVEEGRRVIIETDALTPAGARRILLGIAAPPRAELWLDAVRVLSATVEDGRWTLLSPG